MKQPRSKESAKRKFGRCVLHLVCLLVLTWTSNAETILYHGTYIYRLQDDALTFLGTYEAVDDQSNVFIPPEVDGFPVVHLGVEALSGVFPMMRSIVIPESVHTIGDWCFMQAPSLTNVQISAQISSIGRGPFVNCTNLQEIVVSASNTYYSSLDGVLFDKLQSNLLQYPGGKEGHYMAPASVTNIAEAAFFASPQLAGVTISSNVASIGAHAFARCGSLSSITIPDSVTTLGDSVFFECTNLTSVIIGESVTSIGDYAFWNCTSLTAVYFRGDAPTLGTNVFLNAVPTVYYQEGANGFGDTFGGRPTAVWVP